MYGGGDSVQQPCGCILGANLWIQAWFGDCVYTSWEMAAFLIGLSSMLFWIVAQLPQFISNWRLQSAEALSPWFLFQWLAGDSFNLLGCLLTGDQLATETLTAMYFMFADSLIISQYMYYQMPRMEKGDEFSTVIDDDGLKPDALCATHTSPCFGTTDAGWSEKATTAKARQGPVQKLPQGERMPLLLNQVTVNSESHMIQPIVPIQEDSAAVRLQLRQVVMKYGLEYGPPTGPPIITDHGSHSWHLGRKNVRLAATAVASVTGLLCVGTVTHQLGWSSQQRLSSAAGVAGRKLMTICGNNPRLWWLKGSGTALGWGSSVLYLGSRVSQLVKNNQRGSAEGLSMAMVTCAIMANLTYGTAIMMRTYSWQDFAAKAPWLLGSVGTVSLDFALLIQAHCLTRYSKAKEINEYTPLLV